MNLGFFVSRLMTWQVVSPHKRIRFYVFCTLYINIATQKIKHNNIDILTNMASVLINTIGFENYTRLRRAAIRNGIDVDVVDTLDPTLWYFGCKVIRYTGNRKQNFSTITGALLFMSELYNLNRHDFGQTPSPFLPTEIIDHIASCLAKDPYVTAKDFGSLILAMLCTNGTPRKSAAYKAALLSICRHYTHVNVWADDMYEASKVASVIRRMSHVPFMTSFRLSSSGLGTDYMWTKIRLNAVRRVIRAGAKRGTLKVVDLRGTYVESAVVKQLQPYADTVTDADIRVFLGDVPETIEVLWA